MANKIKPIKPGEAVKKKIIDFPDEVFEAFNELITQDLEDGCACVLQKDAVALMKKKGLREKDIYKKGWLNIEDAYEKAGWKVEYDKPAYNESYDANFTFKARNRRTAY